MLFNRKGENFKIKYNYCDYVISVKKKIKKKILNNKKKGNSLYYKLYRANVQKMKSKNKNF